MATPQFPTLSNPKSIRPQDDPFLRGEKLPQVCVIEDLCRALRMSRPQIYHLRRLGTFPIPEMEPRIDGRPRWRGEDVERFLNGDYNVPRRRAAK